MDILLVTAPQSVASCLSSVGKAGKTAMLRAQSKFSDGMGRGLKSRSKSNVGADAVLTDSDAVIMNTNSAMVQALQRGGGSSTAPTSDAASIGDMHLPPQEEDWPAVRAACIAANERQRLLQAEGERLRAQIARAESVGASSGAAVSSGLARERRAFGPTQTVGGKSVAVTATGKSSGLALKALRQGGGAPK